MINLTCRCLISRQSEFQTSLRFFTKSNLFATVASEQSQVNVNQKKVKLLSKPELHCMHVVRKYDYEGHLASILLDRYHLRRTAFALRAFNVELAQIRDLTKSDAMAQIRFQFWIDILDDIYRNKAESSRTPSQFDNFPVALELQHAILNGELSKHWLTKMIDTRRNALYLSEFPFQTMDQLEKYCEATLVSLYYLLNEKVVQLCGNHNAGFRISLDHIANHLGKAQGVCNILRGIRHNSTYRRCYVPNDILLKSSSTHQDFLRATSSEQVSNAVFELASHANAHLDHAVQLIQDLKSISSRQDRRVFLPVVAIRAYLDLLQQCHFDIFDTRLYRKNGLLPWRMWWRAKLI